MQFPKYATSIRTLKHLDVVSGYYYDLEQLSANEA